MAKDKKGGKKDVHLDARTTQELRALEKKVSDNLDDLCRRYASPSKEVQQDL